MGVQPGVTEDELARWEARNGIALPPEFREYLTVVNGMVDWESDDEWISFHSLGRIEEMMRDYGPWPALEEGFPFADYSLLCWEYGIRINPGREKRPIKCVYDDVRAPEVAASFPEFIRRYLDDPVPVLFPKPK